MLNTVIWWTGASVLAAGAALAVAGAVAGISIVAVLIARYYVRRIYNAGSNIALVHEWVRAGRPTFGQTADGMGWRTSGPKMGSIAALVGALACTAAFGLVIAVLSNFAAIVH